MKILEFLKSPLEYQLLNRRFYNGIHPHWFNRVEKIPLKIRLTEVTGVRDARLNDFEFPAMAYIDGLTRR
jgi:hypothetical protein